VHCLGDRVLRIKLGESMVTGRGDGRDGGVRTKGRPVPRTTLTVAMRIFDKVAAIQRENCARHVGEEGDKQPRDARKLEIAKQTAKKG